MTDSEEVTQLQKKVNISIVFKSLFNLFLFTDGPGKRQVTPCVCVCIYSMCFNAIPMPPMTTTLVKSVQSESVFRMRSLPPDQLAGNVRFLDCE